MPLFFAHPVRVFIKQKSYGRPQYTHRVQYEAPTLEQFLVQLRAEGWQGEIWQVFQGNKIVFSLSGEQACPCS